MVKNKSNALKGMNLMQQQVLASQGIVIEESKGSSAKELVASGKAGYTWDRFGFICDKVLIAKVKAIATKEDVKLRDLMEHIIRKGIASYEKKNGKVQVPVDSSGRKRLEDIL